MTTKRGEQTGGAASRAGGVANLDARRAARDAQVFEQVVEQIHGELVRQGVSALKIPVDAFVPAAGSLERLRRAARLAGARYGWAKTRTTKVVDDGGVEWLVMGDFGPDLGLVDGTNPRLRRVIQGLLAPDGSP